LFILDSTGTIIPDEFDEMIAFVIRVIQNLYISADGVHVAVMTYNTVDTLIFNFNVYTNRYDIINALINIQFVEGSGSIAKLYFDLFTFQYYLHFISCVLITFSVFFELIFFIQIIFTKMVMNKMVMTKLPMLCIFRIMAMLCKISACAGLFPHIGVTLSWLLICADLFDC